jgi:hypothetical protein
MANSVHLSASMLDENEFVSPYGIRALSRFHGENPYIVNVGGQEFRVNYLPRWPTTGACRAAATPMPILCTLLHDAEALSRGPRMGHRSSLWIRPNGFGRPH